MKQDGSVIKTNILRRDVGSSGRLNLYKFMILKRETMKEVSTHNKISVVLK